MTSRGSGVRTRLNLATTAAVGLLLLVGLAVVVLARGADTPSMLQMLVGRLHPLVVHLPIGFLLLAFVLEILSRVQGMRRVAPAVPAVLVLSAASAVGAALAGYLLAATGGYAGPTVEWHKRFGIAVAVAAVAAPALWYLSRVRRAAWLRRAYEGTLMAAVALIILAGHLGGTLTRGPDYLTEYMPPSLARIFALLPGESTPTASFGRIEDARVYEDLVRPVLAARCVSCHGADVQKGSLRLDSPEGIQRGGRSHHTVIAGNAEESELIRRIWLPEGHEDAMPPRGRKPLSVVEAELIRWWIDQGASFDQTIAQVHPPAAVLAILEYIAGPQEERIAPVLRTEIAAADPTAIQAARELGVAVVPLAHGTAFLRAHCRTAPAACGSEQVQVLAPLADQLTVLDLGGTLVTDDDLATLGRMRNLTRLHLERTAITDAGLAHLNALDHLEYLNLFGTAVTDAGLEQLAHLKNLRSLYLWQTGATPDAVARLSELRPSLTVHLGLPEPVGSASLDAHPAFR